MTDDAATIERRGPGRPQTIESADIVRGALAIADRDGVDAVSMRRVAAELGIAVTTVYSHVSDKRELIGLMRAEIATVFDIVLDPGASWRDQLRSGMLQLAEAHYRHPSGIDLLFTPPIVFDPHVRQHSERLIAALQAAGFPRPTAIETINLMHVYVAGVVNHTRIQHRRAEEFTRMAADGRIDPAAPDGRHAREWVIPISDETFEAGLSALITMMGARTVAAASHNR